MSILLLLVASSLASPTPKPTTDPFLIRIGMWLEAPRKEDSLACRTWAKALVDEFDRRISSSGLRHRAQLQGMTFVPQGALPLAGGDPRHHPDLRVDSFDLVWGVRSSDDLAAAAIDIQRTWLNNCGCLDERSFTLGWDEFMLTTRPDNRLESSQFPLDGGVVHHPGWSLLPGDATLTLSCRRAIEPLLAGHGPLYSDGVRVLQRTSALLSIPMVLEVRDASGHPASGAILELWRGRPSTRRPYATLLDGAPDTLVADSAGHVTFDHASAWLCDTLPWTHGSQGSCGTSYWRVQHAHRRNSGWLDAGALLELPDSLDTLRFRTVLPGGSTQAWKEASEHWPRPWVAAEADSLGTLTLGISIPARTTFVLRLVDERGREAARFNPITLEPGIYEKRLERIHARSGWDVRLDAPSSRLQSRIKLR